MNHVNVRMLPRIARMLGVASENRLPLQFCAWWVTFLSVAIASAAEVSPTGDWTHSRLIRAWDKEALSRGEKLYQSICVTCHGTPDQAGSLPTSRPFWKEPFKNGNDPLSLYRTIDSGLGQMPAWPWLDPRMRYDVIHYIRETFLKPHNAAAYFPVSAAYMSGLPTEVLRMEASPEAKEWLGRPRYLRMDFGQLLQSSYEVDKGNIAYKGIAIRLDQGPGGVSKGHAWLVYDQDTMRVAAGWSGDQFVDWKGVAFDGSHQTHLSIVGKKAFVNPVGPGWAHASSGTFGDPRFLGRDSKPYGPLPRDWVRLRGLYAHEGRVVLSYTVGEVSVFELPGCATNGADLVFTRTLEISKAVRDLVMRIAPAGTPVAVAGGSGMRIEVRDGLSLLHVPASATPVLLTVQIGSEKLSAISGTSPRPSALIRGGNSQWNRPIVTSGRIGASNAAFEVDEISHPSDEQNSMQSWMRMGGFDFFKDGKRAAVCTWLGEVWLVDGIDGDMSRLSWKRIAAGLFQPLGLKIVGGVIHVTCRNQLVRLHDLNGDEEIDFYENFNDDHQVTEHFHEFAMGLQTDAAGNFYYAKSARHALTAIVPHHGTLLRVSADGQRTDIVASGFRAANGVCVNEDGTFFVTDQEGHWIPKNRINWVRPGGFYGNMFGFHDRSSSADADMDQPVVWITNDMDRSPGEIVRVTSEQWGPLRGKLLNLSYGTGKIFLVPHETVNHQMQGGVVALPIAELPTGVMRGRFHPGNGQLYACGLFSWAGNRTADGGFYRIRRTGKPMYLPLEVYAEPRRLTLRFSDELNRSEAEDARNYSLRSWRLKRSANYGSKHYDERTLAVESAKLERDGRTVRLVVPDLQPAMSVETAWMLKGLDGAVVSQKLHHTIHALGNSSR